MDLIIHHAKCPDGFCAALIAKKRYPEAELLALDHGEPVPFEAVRGKDVLVVDFSWPTREDNIKLNEIAKSFHVYDHHKTAQERLVGLDFVTLDMRRSGAGLAWDYLFGKDNKDRPAQVPGGNSGDTMYLFKGRPWWVNYVEDRDLWNWILPESKAVNAYLMSLPMTIEAWSHLDTISAADAVLSGSGILRHIERYVKEAVEEAAFGHWYLSGAPENPFCFEYYTVAVVNLPYMNCSEVGNVLAGKAAVSMTWFERADGQIQFSLRSEGGIDVGAIAKKFLGGGHLHAAGFRLPIDEGRKLIDSILGRSNG